MSSNGRAQPRSLPSPGVQNRAASRASSAAVSAAQATLGHFLSNSNWRSHTQSSAAVQADRQTPTLSGATFLLQTSAQETHTVAPATGLEFLGVNPVQKGLHTTFGINVAPVARSTSKAEDFSQS